MSNAHVPERRKPLSYDPRCENLAAACLVDRPPFSIVEKEDLAQTIQDAIEDWFLARSLRPIGDE